MQMQCHCYDTMVFRDWQFFQYFHMVRRDEMVKNLNIHSKRYIEQNSKKASVLKL